MPVFSATTYEADDDILANIYKVESTEDVPEEIVPPSPSPPEANPIADTPAPYMKSDIISQKPVKYKDYVCTAALTHSIRYPISASGCAPTFQHYVMAILNDDEPKSYTQASKD